MISKNELDRATDRLIMVGMGSRGNTKAHWWLVDRATGVDVFPSNMLGYLNGKYDGTRVFQPPKADDRVLMFNDFSGIYVHSTGLHTIMDADISDQVNGWPLLHGPDWFTTPLPA